jgi:nitrogen-specific signal transduction histidine kinase
VRRNLAWIVLLVSLVMAQIAASLLIGQGTALTLASDMIQAALLLAATAAFLPAMAKRRSPSLHSRIFWILMGGGMLLWLVYQGMWNYFEVIKRQDVPEPFLGDIVLFLHLVPMIAALAVMPHLRDADRDERVRMLDFALVLTWWLFFYLYFVVPWQTVDINEAAYNTNFNFAYLTEKLALLVSLGALAYTARGGWRHVYGQFLGASALYASSSYVANWAIGYKTYFTGSIYDIPLIISMAWMATIPILAERRDLSELRTAKPMLGLWVTRVSMLALFSLPWAALRAESSIGLSPAVRAFRISVSLLAMVVMGTMVFWRQRLLGAELSYFVEDSSRSLTELKALQERLIHSEKLASLGQLVGGAAHEINNPLTAMLGYSDLLSASPLPPQEQEQAARIGQEVRRTKTLVASLLTFARQTPAKLSAIDLNSVLQTSIRLLAPQSDSPASVIRLESGAGLPAVHADSNQLIHVCLHLAGQVGAKGASGTRSPVVIRTYHDRNSVMVDFFADAPSASDPSFSSPLSSQGVNKPSTLSLSACCRIVEEHGGRLLQAAAPMAAFRMELPIALKSAAGQSNRAAARNGY